MSLRSKVENIWYHYKFQILMSLFLICVLVISLYSCVTKPEFDIQVYYVTGSSALYNEQLAWIEKAVASQCEDTNGDGEIKVAVTGLRVGKNTDPSERAQYMNAVQAGEIMLFFCDEGGVQYLYQNNYLQTLEAFTDKTDGEGYAWKVNGTPFSQKTEGFSDVFSENLFVSLRVFDDTWASAFAGTKANYEGACNVLRNMISLQSEGK